MTKIALFSFLLAVAPFGGAYADNHEHSKEKCSCTKECKENCEKGKSKDCQCKECDCKESTHCEK